VDGDNEPVIGNWMLVECSRNAAKLAGIWPKFTVSADLWKNSIQFWPVHIPLTRNGSIIREPDTVEPYTITTRVQSKGGSKMASFFKAYQAIKAGAQFEMSISFPDDLCTKVEGRGATKQIVADVEKTQECVNAVLDKMCIVGLGAYRLRFGKFRFV